MNRFMKGLSDPFSKAKKLNYVSVSDVVKKYRDTLQYDVSSDKLLSKIILWSGDITKLESDAIVNAANETLLGGGGVDGAIHFAAGPQLLDECKGLGGCETGQAKITKGYCLPAKYVIHTVGPRYRGRQIDKEHLAGCYENSLNLVLDNDIKTIAFPCISTGIFGYPNKDAADVALSTVRKWLSKNLDRVENIIFCLFLEKDVDIYTEAIKDIYEQNNKDMEGLVNDSNVQKEDVNNEKEASQAPTTSLSNDTDNQIGDTDGESGELTIQQPEDRQQSGCDEVDASPSGKSLEGERPEHSMKSSTGSKTSTPMGDATIDS